MHVHDTPAFECHYDVANARSWCLAKQCVFSLSFRLFTVLTGPDFGLSVCYNGTDIEAKCGGGTRFYMAPEQWLEKSARTPGRDIWAAGMVLAQLFAGKAAKKALRDYKIFCVRCRQIQSFRINTK